LPGYWQRETRSSRRWQYFRLNNHGHNTLTPGQQLQEPSAVAPILRFASTPGRAFAVADLAPAYPGAATRHHRGLAMLNRARVLVQDDIEGLAPGLPLTWRMLTGTTVNVDSPGVATLTQSGRTLRVQLLSPTSARFIARHAAPPTPIENQNEGITVLEVKIPATDSRTNMRIAVLLSPVGEKWSKESVPEIVPLDEWK
jgi:hypothetical protein